jgi:chemotaxis signal transduction protein
VKSKFRELYAEAIEKTQGHEKQAAIYRIGNILFLIPLQEIIDLQDVVEIRNVPGAAEFFKGFFIYDGKPIMLIDMPYVLSLPRDEAHTAMIVKTLGNDAYALLIKDLVQVAPYSDSWVQSLPAEVEKIKSEYIEKVFRIDQNILYQIKINKLFSKNHI